VVLVEIGAGQIFCTATTNTPLQVITPDHSRGRVMRIYMLNRGLMAIDAKSVGVSAHWIVASATVSYIGLVVIAMVVVLSWRSPAIRDLPVSMAS